MEHKILVTISKKIEKKLQRKEKRYETDQLMKEKRSEDYEVLEEVFDRPTLMTLYSFLNRGIIKEIHGVVGAGKESRIYRGVNPEGEDLAIKIYLTISAEFRRGMLTYIQGDPRFKNVKRSTRSMIYLWAQKEFKNLHRAYHSNVSVPKPIHVEKNILLMDFIGDNGTPAPLLKDKIPKKPYQMYKTLLSNIKTLYQKAHLVHSDISEYNVMVYHEKPVLFDFSQAVTLEHPMSTEFLRRDINNLNRFFKKLNVRTRKADIVFKWATKDD
jgi:RIO kinase 1